MFAAAASVWWLWLFLAGLFVAWRIDVEIRPYAPCRRCGGSGRGRFSTKSAFNVCRHGQRRTRAFARGAAARHDRRRGL